jgi:hypothetical protein
MVEIFFVQLLVAAVGGASTATADWFYHSGRIRQRVHSFWVSTSIAVICFPVLVWTSNVFLGAGVLGQLTTGILIGSMFLWVYRNLQRLPPFQALNPQPPQQPSGGAAPPTLRLNP